MVQRLIKYLILTLILFSSPVFAADWYVSPTGSDSDTGASLDHAFLTIQKGADAMSPGDTVNVYDGTYSGAVVVTKTGTSAAPKNISGITQANPGVITVTSHGYSNGDTVYVLGLTNHITTGMQQLFGRLFKVANATSDTFTLTEIDGTAINTTSFDPYVSGGTVQKITGLVTIKAINRGQVIFDPSTTITGWSGSGLPANTYDSGVFDISATSAGDGILWKVGSNYLTQVSSSANVTSEGKYFYDTSSKKFRIYTSSNPTLATYKGYSRTTANLFKIDGSTYVLVDGLKFQYCQDCLEVRSSIAETSHIVLEHITTAYTVRHGGIYVLGGDTFQLHNVTIGHGDLGYTYDTGVGIDANGYAIKCGGNSNTSNFQYLTVYSSTIHDTYRHGVQFSNGATSLYLWGNTIYGYSLVGSGSAAGVRSGQGETNHLTNKDTQIFDNNIGYGAGGIGYSLGCSIYIQDDNAKSEIFRNRIHHNQWHGIYLFYTSGAQGPSYSKIHNNLIYENRTAGIRSDSTYGGVNGNIDISNNSFYLNGELSVFGAGATLSLPQLGSNGIGFRNNIVFNDSAYQIYSSTATHIYPSDNNVFYSASGSYKFFFNGTTYNSLATWNAATTGVTAAGLDSLSVSGDPLFGAPSSGDFRIPSPSTPADARGVNLSSLIPYDYALAARQVPFDSGAYNTQGNLVLFPQVTLSSYFPGASGTASISFTTSELTVNKNWKIVFTFPADFVLNNGGSTVAQNFTHMDGTFTTSVVGQVVTITRNNDGTNSAPNTYTFDLTHVKNPDASGRTGKYSISLTDSSDVMQGESLLFQDSLITQLNPGAISGATINGAIIQ